MGQAFLGLAISIYTTCLLIVVALLLTVEARTWTAGEYKMDGDYDGVSEDGAKVLIKTADGKRIKVLFHKLSPEDQEFVKSSTRSAGSVDGNPFEDADDANNFDRGLEVVPHSNQYVLLIGVNEYVKPIRSLRYCVNDLKLLAKRFEAVGVPAENIYLIADDQPVDRRPSGTNICRFIENITKTMDVNDQLLVVYSGHGALVNGKSYLCPSDTNLRDVNSIILRDWVFEQLEQCKAKQKVFIVDACREIVEFGEKKSLEGARTIEDPIGADTHGFILIASCDREQCSYELPELEHGVFTYFLAEGLAGKAQDEDGYVSVLNLFQYASAKTKKYVLRERNSVQVPTFRAGGEMSDFCVAKLKVTPTEEQLELERLRQEKSTVEQAWQQAEARARQAEADKLAAIEKAKEDLARLQVGGNQVTESGSTSVVIPPQPQPPQPQPSVLMMPSLAMMPPLSTANPLPSNPRAGDRWVKTIKDVEFAFRYCPAGEFMMGSPEHEKGRSDNETQHNVMIYKGFWMMETEVTQKQWKAVMGLNPSYFKGDNLPVEEVSWSDCQDFCKKLTALGLPVGLPSEAQWEYACRAGTTEPYSGDIYEMGWYDSNSKNKTHSVGTTKSNLWGLYDMHGNVWEWCQDTYQMDISFNNTEKCVVDGNKSLRVLRGGSWLVASQKCRSALRFSNSPEFRFSYVGFRCVQQ